MSGAKGILRNMVRFDPTMGPEGTYLMRCDDCAARGESTAYWPLTSEFWLPSQGLQRCRACHRVRARQRHRQSIEQRRATQRRHYREVRDVVLAYRRAYYVKNHERICEQRRQSYARRTTHEQS